MRLKLLCLVLVASVTCLLLWEVERERGNRARARGSADARPEAEVPDRPGKQPGGGATPREGQQSPTEVASEAPEPVRLPLEVRFHDALTGTPIEGRWRLRDGETEAGIRLNGPQRIFGQWVELYPPEGWTAHHGLRVWIHGRASVFAGRLALQVPLVREAKLRLRFHYANGDGPPRGPVRTYVSLFGRGLSVRPGELNEDGVAVLHGVPFAPGAKLQLNVEHGSFTQYFPRMLPDRNYSVEFAIPLRVPDPSEELIADHSEFDEDIEFEELIDDAPPPPDTELRVLALRRNGRPAAGALLRVESHHAYVWSGPLDREGRALVRELAPGAYLLVVDDAGFASPPRVGVAIRHGDRAEAVIRESPGWTARVLVLDRNRQPLPGIRVEVPGYALIVDEVQQAVLYTGPDGRIELPGLPDRGIHVDCEQNDIHIEPGHQGSQFVVRLTER